MFSVAFLLMISNHKLKGVVDLFYFLKSLSKNHLMDFHTISTSKATEIHTRT